MNIAIIPARKNSIRIKNKNIKLFNKKPIIEWSIKVARESNLFKKIYVSTDSKKISDISISAGAESLYPRPKKISGNRTTISEVLVYEINKLKRKIKFNNVCCIFPTAPLLKKNHLKKGLRKLNKNTDYVFSALKDEKSTLRNFFFYKKKLLFSNKKFINFRSQDLPLTYKDAGQFYWASKKTWLKKKNIFSLNLKIIILSNKYFVDIDKISDWRKALKILNNEKK